MSNGYPYFQFHCDRWLTGKIAALPLEEQALFLHFCMMAWVAKGAFNICSALVQRRFNKTQEWVDATIACLLTCGIMVKDGDSYRIKFIDAQLADMSELRGKRSMAGKASAAVRTLPHTPSQDKYKKRKGKVSILPCSTHVNTCSTHVRFVPPTLDEVKAEIAAKGYRFEAETFIAHYEANGWVQGHGKPVKSWKACCVTFERNVDRFSGPANGYRERPDPWARYIRPQTQETAP
jgi:hypothetical protein